MATAFQLVTRIRLLLFQKRRAQKNRNIFARYVKKHFLCLNFTWLKFLDKGKKYWHFCSGSSKRVHGNLERLLGCDY